ncbi:MAG: hypothetical protein U0T81_17545 [Saprospiraceae bacterium]
MKYEIDKKDRYAVFSLEESNLNSLIAPQLKSEFVFYAMKVSAILFLI